MIAKMFCADLRYSTLSEAVKSGMSTRSSYFFYLQNNASSSVNAFHTVSNSQHKSTALLTANSKQKQYEDEPKEQWRWYKYL